jgi:hypothetical protein
METMDYKPAQDERTVVRLLRELRDEMTTLLKQELALARTEVAEKAAIAGRNIAFLAIGGLVAYAGLLFILYGMAMALSSALETAGLTTEWAVLAGPALVGLIVALIGWAMVAKARRTLRPERLAPEKTIQTLKEDKQWAQQKVQRT